jgi:hypothetical protein
MLKKNYNGDSSSSNDSSSNGSSKGSSTFNIVKSKSNGSSNSSSSSEKSSERSLVLANNEISSLKAIISSLKSSSSSPNFSYSSSPLSPGIITYPKNPKPTPNSLKPENSKISQNPHNLKVSKNNPTGSSPSRGVNLGGQSPAIKNGRFSNIDIDYRDSLPTFPSEDLNPNLDSITTYSSASLIIRASNDFRLIIPVPSNKSFRISWEFSISIVPKKDKATPSNLDIGFSVIEKLPDGSLPQIIPYRLGFGLGLRIVRIRVRVRVNNC